MSEYKAILEDLRDDCCIWNAVCDLGRDDLLDDDLVITEHLVFNPQEAFEFPIAQQNSAVIALRLSIFVFPMHDSSFPWDVSMSYVEATLHEFKRWCEENEVALEPALDFERVLESFIKSIDGEFKKFVSATVALLELGLADMKLRHE